MIDVDAVRAMSAHVTSSAQAAEAPNPKCQATQAERNAVVSSDQGVAG